MTDALPSGATAFLQARDFLLAHRDDHASAWRDFRWPALGAFNWALDHFDALARGNRGAPRCGSSTRTAARTA